MKTSLRLTLLTLPSILCSVSCDKKTETASLAPAPAVTVAPTAVDEKLIHDGAERFLQEYKGLYENMKEALNTGDTSKLKPLIAKATELGTKGKEWAAKLKPEEMEAYSAKLGEYSKPFNEAVSKLGANALEAGKAKLDALRNGIRKISEQPVPTVPAAPEPTSAADAAPAGN